jgi:hypothetical protein
MLFTRRSPDPARTRARSRRPKAQARPRLEGLEPRALLAVNFTGNVAVDFPVGPNSGVVRLAADPATDQIAEPDSDVAALVKVSGFAITAIRLKYDNASDTLAFGLEQPDNGKTGRPVIAGDADNNGNSGTVDPAVRLVSPEFTDPADLGGTETMGVFLDLNNDGKPDVVAGFSQLDLRSPKPFQVAVATPGSRPGFGERLPQHEGNLYLVNSPRHPNLEFSLAAFRELFATYNGGKAPTSQSVIRVGAFGGSLQDGSNSESFLTLKPTPLNVPPEVTPPGVVNPHQGGKVDIVHVDDVQVVIFSTPTFDARTIVPETVRFGGARPILVQVPRDINGDGLHDRLFVFRSTDLKLPPGRSEQLVTGSTADGKTFTTRVTVDVTDRSAYKPADLKRLDLKRRILGPVAFLTPTQLQLGPKFFNPGAKVLLYDPATLKPRKASARR